MITGTGVFLRIMMLSFDAIVEIPVEFVFALSENEVS